MGAGAKAKTVAKFINFIDRVSARNTFDTLSWICGRVTLGFFCKWIGLLSFGLGILTICSANTSGMRM
jgi:hypothetical protein